MADPNWRQVAGERLRALNFARRRHGMTNTLTWQTWKSMVGRCKYPGPASHKRYAGRGITVCERWMTFENFLADMGERPEGMTLDRIDSDGHYEPGNCRWADASTQARNRAIPSSKGPYKGNRSGIVGVYWNKETQSWRASKKIDGRNHYIGLFPTVAEAKAAYDAFVH